jgi:signal transduction histidine kinase/ActR/RegA family two-component response regulator
MFLSFLFFSCGKQEEVQTVREFQYNTFRDIPGVTSEEIKAIEDIRGRYDSFTYGMPLSTEAFINENGEVRGYAALLCEWLTDFFEIPFKPKLFEWLELLALMEKKEVAFSGELTATEERHKIYSMTSDIASRPLKYFTLKGSKPIEDIFKERKLRCGFISGTATINTVVSELPPGTFDIILLNDVSLVYGALKSGMIDAFYYSGTAEANFIEYSDMTSNQFYPLIYRPVSLATQDPALSPFISVVEKALEHGGIRYFISLYNRGEREYLQYKLHIQLTDEEKAYIAAHPVIPIGADPGNYPVCFFNKRDSEWQGFFFDILDDLSSFTGLSFNIVNDQFTKWPEIYQMLLEGKTALIPELTQTQDREGMFLWADALHMADFYALLSNSDYPNIKINEILYAKVGLAKGTSYTAMFQKWFPNHMNTVEFESMEDALTALYEGNVEMVMANRNRLVFLTHYLEYPGYKANVVFAQPIETKFGLNKDEDVLLSIVNKSLALIDSRTITDQWLRRTYDYRAKMVEAQRPWFLLISVLLLGLLTLGTFVFKNKLNEGMRLEVQVKQRTAELNKSQEELKFALEAAKAADNSKSAFLAHMSHEIRTPMNSILGFSELAMDGEVSDKTKDYLTKIHTNADWLLQIINNILDISKIESGKMELEKIPFDMHELFVSCRTLILPKAVEKGLMLHFYAEPSIGQRPLGDPTRLRQVFVNLLSNAIKFTESGMIKLYTEILDKTKSTTTMHFEVIDSGIGMTAEQIDKVFNPFAQAETGTTRKYGGTGLGLSITKNIVELMGGKLVVESTPGLGSKFWFNLTFETMEAPIDKTEKKILLHDNERPVFSGEILVCEDNDMNQMVICEHLERIGLKAVIAENGKVGVDIVKERMEKNEKMFDLIFMDMHMPVMDGLEAASEIQKLNAGIPIVAMTANIMSNDIEVYKTSGMNDYIGKPFTSQELWQCLMRYLEPVSMGTG